MNEIDIPRYLDAQPQLFFWELDEAIVFIGCLAAGIAVGGWGTLISIVGGIAAVKGFKRFKQGALDGVLHHICYWFGVMALNEVYEDSSVRDYFL